MSLVLALAVDRRYEGKLVQPVVKFPTDAERRFPALDGAR